MKEIRSLPSEEKLEKTWESQGKRFGVSERGLGDEKTEVSRERSTKISCGSHEENIYTISKSRQMRCQGGVETSVEQVTRKATSTDHVSRSCRGKKTPEPRYEARSIQQVSRSSWEVRNFLDWSTRYRGAVEITIRKSLGSSIDS